MMLMLKANNGEIRGMRIVGRPIQSVLLLQGMKKSKKINFLVTSFEYLIRYKTYENILIFFDFLTVFHSF